MSIMTRNFYIFSTAFICAFSIMIAAFLPYLQSLISAWNSEEYSHGYILPFISFLIGWNMLAQKKPISQPSWIGIIVLIAGFLLLTISELSAFEPLAHYGFILCLTGLILSFFGVQYTKVISFSLIYLLFCIPLPRLIQVTLSAEMQLISSTLGVYILQVLGISVFQEGNIIDLGHQKLQVVEACNGLRYLFPFMSLSFLISFLFQDKMWKRVVIFLSSLPITIFMNSARIAWVGILVNWKGPSMAEGIVHDLQGWTVFVACLVILCLETWILSRIGKSKGFLSFEKLEIPFESVKIQNHRISKVAILSLVICLCFYVWNTAEFTERRAPYIPERLPFSTFPKSTGEWHGKQKFLETAVLETLNVSDYFLAQYTNQNYPEGLELYIAYYEKQGVGTSIHSPANCIPGGGWKIAETHDLGIDLGNNTIPVSKLLIEKGNQKLLVYYWFSQRGRILNSQYEAKYYLLFDSIIKNRSDGALIRITATLPQGTSQNDIDLKVKAFLKNTYSSIEHYIPD